jgi:hypothetical protein
MPSQIRPQGLDWVRQRRMLRFAHRYSKQRVQEISVVANNQISKFVAFPIHCSLEHHHSQWGIQRDRPKAYSPLALLTRGKRRWSPGTNQPEAET